MSASIEKINQAINELNKSFRLGLDDDGRTFYHRAMRNLSNDQIDFGLNAVAGNSKYAKFGPNPSAFRDEAKQMPGGIFRKQNRLVGTLKKEMTTIFGGKPYGPIEVWYPDQDD